MAKKIPSIERRLYTARFRRDLNSLKRQLDDPACALQRVIILSRSAGEPAAVLITATAYAVEIAEQKIALRPRGLRANGYIKS